MIHKSLPAGAAESPPAASQPTRELQCFFHVHLVSDSTGETLINVMRASVAQFKDAAPLEHLYALVRSERQMTRVLRAIEDLPGVVLYTILDDELRLMLERRCAELGAPCEPILDPVVGMLSRYIGVRMEARPGAQRALDEGYYERIEALDFAMAHDDGQQLDTIHNADVVLVGVSRTSKTPTCIYLAHRGVRAANVPLIPGSDPPAQVDALRDGPLVVGLTATPDRLVNVRRNRLLGLRESRMTDYVDETAVRDEVKRARRLFGARGWPVIDVTRRSVEETAAKVMNLLAEHRGESTS